VVVVPVGGALVVVPTGVVLVVVPGVVVVGAVAVTLVVAGGTVNVGPADAGKPTLVPASVGCPFGERAGV
jgi:hypothetical protein